MVRYYSLDFALLRGPRDDDCSFPVLIQKGFQIGRKNGNLPLIIRHLLPVPIVVYRRLELLQFPLEKREYNFLIRLFPGCMNELAPEESLARIGFFFLKELL